MVNPALLLAGAVGAAVVLGGGKRKAKMPPLFVVKLDAPPMTEPKKVVIEHGEETNNFGKSACELADKQPMPSTATWLPAPVVAAGGPILTVVKLGIDFVTNVFKAVGASQVCTVRGGRYKQLAVVHGTRRFWAHVEVSYKGHPPAATWRYGEPDGEQHTGAGELTLTSSGVDVEDGQGYDKGEAAYLYEGGEPPGHLWPHVNIATFRAYVPPDLDMPRIFLGEAGEGLALGVWLPPRAPLSHVNNATGKRIVDAPVVWTVRWMVT